MSELDPFIRDLQSPDLTHDLAGGKGVNLSQIARQNFPVPMGFILTTEAYTQFVEANNLRSIIMKGLAGLTAEDQGGLDSESVRIRSIFLAGEIPFELENSIRRAYRKLSREGDLVGYDKRSSGDLPVAVRSSATAEDLPDMSFAGQHDTFLNINGESTLLEAVINCWSSLWTTRAISYRIRNQIPHEDVTLAVIIQKMVPSDSSGVLFTANPLNGKRSEMVVDATFGLGEALVEGQIEPDHFLIDSNSGQIIDKKLGSKGIPAHRELPGGGFVKEIDHLMERQSISDEALQQLVDFGRRLESYFQHPQDVEWAWFNNSFFILQSRPITTLYPLPEHKEDNEELRVYFSFGAVQGMLDPITPFGQNTIEGLFAGAGRLFGLRHSIGSQRVIVPAGERLFIDLTRLLHHPIGRRFVFKAMWMIEPGTAQVLESLRDDSRIAPSRNWFRFQTLFRVILGVSPFLIRFIQTQIRPGAMRRALILKMDEMLKAFESRIRNTTTLTELMEVYYDVIDKSFSTAVRNFVPPIAVSMSSLNMVLMISKQRTGREVDALLLTRGLSHNVTTEMDLALWAVAKIIQNDPVSNSEFQNEEAEKLAARYQNDMFSPPIQSALDAFLEKYGMRGISEIDIGRIRWKEDPAPVIKILQSYIEIRDPKLAPDIVFKSGKESARSAAEGLRSSVRKSKFGWVKIHLLNAAINRIRILAGLREAPKFFMVRMLGLIRERLLEFSQLLVEEKIFERPTDIFFLNIEEVQALAEGVERDWLQLVKSRRQNYEREKKRGQIPRLLFSDGQTFYGRVDQTIDSGIKFLIGNPVSPGTVEGSAIVILDPFKARVEQGEIIVCPGTDPAWTPFFLTAGGLVTEVGGLMTHGSVVAREYGIPAVVGVTQATKRIKTGQMIRVDGSTGRIQIID